MSYIVRISCLVFLICNTLQAQIATSCNAPYDNATALVNLLVDGIPFSNATLTGFECSAGYFDGSASNIDLSAGLVLSTGGAEMLPPGGTESSGSGLPMANPDLEEQFEIAMGSDSPSLYDVITLEFDFVPNSNKISFEYVFSSNEYPEFVCSGYNDIFAFFLSGPGISGPFSNNAVNIALVPDPDNPGAFTDTPVMINTVNPGVSGTSGTDETCAAIDEDWQDYSVFYTDNAAHESVNIDGFTTPLIAQSDVIPCETYHIKLVIADAGDAGYNSAVFLLENSFSSTGTFMESSSEYGPWSGNDTTLVEGCFDGELTFGLTESIQTDYIIDFEIGGTATEGIDFETMGSQAIISAGETETSIPLVPFYDGIVEGDETLSIYATVTDGCNEEELEFNFLIVDRLPMYMDTLPDIYFCPGDLAITINPGIIGGIYPMSYEWLYDGAMYSNQEIINIQPDNLGDYTFQANGLCDSEVSASFETFLLEPDLPLTILSTYNSIEACLGDVLSTEIQIAGGIGEPSIMWYIDGVPFKDTLNFTVPTEIPYDYNLELIINDQCS